jgi:hypothetical protein
MVPRTLAKELHNTHIFDQLQEGFSILSRMICFMVKAKYLRVTLVPCRLMPVSNASPTIGLHKDLGALKK